jgi:hypothetical protein
MSNPNLIEKVFVFSEISILDTVKERVNYSKSSTTKCVEPQSKGQETTFQSVNISLAVIFFIIKNYREIKSYL